MIFKILVVILEILEHQKKFVNDDFLLKNTSIWKEKKNHGSPPLCMFKDLSFSYGNLDQAARQTGNFPHTSLPRSVYSRHSCLVHRNSFARSIRKIAKIAKNYEKCLSYFKYVLPLFHIVRKNPLKKLEHHVDSHDDIEIHSAENNRFTNG